MNEIEWLRANGYVEKNGRGVRFILDSPLKRKLDADEKRLKRKAIRLLQRAGAFYDFHQEQWVLPRLWSPAAFDAMADKQATGGEE